MSLLSMLGVTSFSVHLDFLEGLNHKTCSSVTESGQVWKMGFALKCALDDLLNCLLSIKNDSSCTGAYNISRT